MSVSGSGSQLQRYVTRLALDWAATEPDRRWRCIDATFCFVDISGFTALSERLARRGRIGAEELTNVLNDVFAELLGVAYTQQGSLVKFGGDALLLAYEGEGHAERACWAAIGMRSALREVGRVGTEVGNVRLRMSVGLHSGDFHMFRVGTPYHELIVTGPAATETTRTEAAAAPGEILVGGATAAMVDASLLGAARGQGRLLRDLRRPAPAGPGPFAASAVDDEVIAGEMAPFLVRHLTAGIAEPEHRTASVGFVKFSGSDGLLARSGPDALADALHLLVSTLQEAAEAERVTLLASDIDDDGGKLILTAGVPTAREDDEGRILRTLRSLLDADLPLAVRAGVNRGHVYAGDVGGTQRRTYTVMGDTVNLAARLAAQAPPGHLYCTSGVLDRSRSRFSTSELEPFMVKGKSAPVWGLDVGPAVSGPGVEEGERLPFVGRAPELGRLLELLADVRRGTGHVAAIVGPVGSGKSRLVRELVRQAAEMRTVTVRGELYGRTTPYLPLRLLLRQLLDVSGDDATELERHLRQAVATHSPALEPWIPLIGTVLALELEPTPEVAALEPEFQRERREAATTELTAALLGDRVVLVVEDAHWLDEPSIGVLRRLAVEATARSWLLVAAMRSPQGLDPEMERMVLGPLDDSAARDLVITATDESPLRPHEIDAIVERAAGNPMFLEEILRAVAVSRDLRQLPESLDAVATAEIDALPPLPRRLLRHASVLGMTFRRDVLDDVVDDDVFGLDHSTRTLLADYLVADGPMLLRFRNRVVRDAAYERLSYRRRRELHDRAGASIEDRHADRLDAYAELLSIHFAAAARHDKAWHYARRAGDLAAAAYANVEAAGQYELAVESGRRLALDRRELAAVMEQLGDVQELGGSYEAAVESFGQAMRQCHGDPIDEARLLLKRSRAAERYGAMRQAVRWVRAGSRLAGRTSEAEAERLRARLLAWEAWLRQQQGRPGVAVRLCRQAIEEAERSGEMRALAQAYMTMDRILTESGRVDEAVYSERALEIYEELGDTYQRATVLTNNGVQAYFRDDWVEALELYARSEALFTEAGSTAIAAGTRCNRAEILVNQRRMAEAEPLLREARRVLRAASHHGGTAFAATQLARVAAATGRAEEADRLLDEARSLYTDIAEHGPILEVDLYQAEAMLAGGHLEAAGIVLAATRAQLGGRPSALLDALEGVLLARIGRAGEARDLVDASLAGPAGLGSYDRALLLDARDLVAELGGGSPADDEDERHRLAVELGLQARPLAVTRTGVELPGLLS